MKLERPETHPGICSLGCSVALGARNCLQVNSSVGYALRTSLEGEAPDGRETEAVNTGPAKPAVEGRRTFQSPCFASATQPLGPHFSTYKTGRGTLQAAGVQGAQSQCRQHWGPSCKGVQPRVAGRTLI